MISCTDRRSENHNGELQSEVVSVLPWEIRIVGLSCTRLFASLISSSVMGSSIYQGALLSLAQGT